MDGCGLDTLPSVADPRSSILPPGRPPALAVTRSNISTGLSTGCVTRSNRLPEVTPPAKVTRGNLLTGAGKYATRARAHAVEIEVLTR